MSGLPEGWALGRLSDACVLINGRAYKQPELLETGKYPVLRVGNFFSNRGWYYSDLELEDNKYCENGDLLYAWSASFGPRIWDGGKVIYHYHIWKTQPDDRIADKRFLFHWFEWDKLNIQADHGTGSTMIHVTKGDMEARQLALPPVPEQRRIVAKIDRLSARSKRARAELGHVPTLIARVKERLLDLALSGALTVDWRRRCRMPDWSMTTLSTLLNDGPTNGWSPKSGDDATGALTLKLTATTSGKLRLDAQATKRIYETPEPNSKFWLEPGDILIQRANTIEYVGTAAIFDGPAATYIFPDLMMRIRPVDLAATRFLWIYLNAPSTKRYFQSKATGTAGNMPKINGETVRMLPVPVIDPKEREEIVRRIEHAFAAIDRLAAEAASAQKLLDRLDQAVLAKAFRGELVPQDPNDEPASVLLDRIRAERAAAPAPKRGRRPKAAP